MLIIITGASKGIGFEMVKLLSKRANTLVIAISRNTESLDKLIEKKNAHSILPVKADITNPLHLKKILKTVSSLKLKVDILINNAGHIVNKPFERISLAELQSVYSTNVLAPFMLIQTLLPAMNPKRRAHILNISSMGGFQGSSKFPGLSAYSSSKSALSGLTECLAEEFKNRNISVNCLALGAVQTEMLGKAFPGYKAPLGPAEMAEFISDFAINGQRYFNGKILPVSLSNP
jgi:3-oxoacyl-[acyl-carrier protein] reductase